MEEEFEKWNKQIEKREEEREGEGGTGQGGGWFGGDKVWEEAIQVIINIFGINLVVNLIIFS